jgi:RND family efflux transporter MFP subunit
MDPSADLPRPPRRIRILGVLTLVIAIALAAGGIAMRVHAAAVLKSHVAENAVPTVTVITPSTDEARQELVLPGNVRPFYEAPIHARVSGYLKNWCVDIGTPVQAGQVLAEIETPELDQQLHQAEADLNTALAKEKLAEVTAKRWQSMVESTSVSKQEADEKQGDYEAKQATVAAEQANVERLQAMTSFKRIVAPFTGIITTRKTDMGRLINAGSGSELFRIVDTHKLRIYVEVPQAYATRIEIGMQAQLTLPELPGQDHPATVVSTSNAIDPASRTLLVQLQTDNEQHQLIAGSYVDVHFQLPSVRGMLQLPVTTLLFRRNGLKVATVGPDDHVVLKQIQLGRDFGTRVEVVSGIDVSDRVIDSPPDWLGQGDQVRPVPGDLAPSGTVPAVK